MLFKKLWRTMALYKVQFISMIIMITLGIGVFMGFNMEWFSIEKNTTAFFKQTGFADYRIVSETGFSAEDLDRILAVDGVKKAARYLSVNVNVSGNDHRTLALTVTEDLSVSGFLVTTGKPYDPQDKDGIWLSDQYAEKNNIALGDTVALSFKSKEIRGTVCGLIKSGEQLICVQDETQLMPNLAAHGFAYISPEMYKEQAGLAYYPQINILSDLDKKTISERIDLAMGKTMLILTKDDTISYSESDGEATEGKTMGLILPTLFLLIAVLTMMTTMHRLAAKEKTQIGILKALGFKDARILRHYTFYALMVGLIGSTLGIGLGYLIAWVIMNPNGMMGTYMDMPEWKLYIPWFCYPVLIGILVLLTLIGFLSVKKMLRGTAADALRPYAPKKMRPLLVERTALFHKLPFGTRWNMRDIARHKTRTAMSLVGIIGCSVLVVASMGMRDTMDAFLSIYYDNGMNYKTRIFLSEEATPEDRRAVISQYDGDYSASISAKIEDKSVSLDIYNMTHGMVKITDEKNNPIDVSSGGAYVCMRIADKFGLKKGDTVLIKPFGTSKTYPVTVAGTYRSVSESILITTECADTIGIPYTIDSVYTNAPKENIASENSAIRNMSSKQDLMDSFATFTEMMNMMIWILVGGALLLGIVVLYNLGVMSYTERYREMATLKVIGFKDRKIGKLLIGENLALSLIGLIAGIPFGVWVLDYLLQALAGEYEMKLVISLPSYLISILLIVGMSLLVSVMVSGKNKKINMVEALKCAD